MATKNQRHFIFGYGSLICHRSRAITAPSLASKPAIPVVVEHLSRTWSARVPRQYNMIDPGMTTTNELEIHGQTAMGIVRAKNTKCSGVLIEVDNIELQHFDIREGGYDRVEIDLIHIWGLNNDDDDKEAHVVLEKAIKKRDSVSIESKKYNDSSDVEDIKVWVYIPRTSLPANKNYPIAQSYVDIILRGCLDYSHNFALHFLNTTQGWWHHDYLGTNSNDNVPAASKIEELDDFVWVQDRDNPLYVRADIDWSTKMAGLVDHYLETHLPHAFTRRKNLNRILTAAEKYEDEFD